MKVCMGLALSYCGIAFAMVASASAGETDVPSPGVQQIEVVSTFEMEVDTHVLRNIDAETLEKAMPGGKFTIPINVVLLQGGDGVMLIDSGIGNGVVEQLAKRGVSTKDVRHIFLTHMHFDHIDGLIDNGEPVFPSATVHLSRQEFGHWSDTANIASYPAEDRETMAGAFTKCAAVFSAYGGRISLFTPNPLGTTGVELLPGVSPVATFGHTPGHTGYLVRCGDSSIFVTGDEILAGAVQFAKPSVTSAFDADQAAAAETRMKVFDFLVRSAMPFTGMHSSGIGVLERGNGNDGGYAIQSR